MKAKLFLLMLLLMSSSVITAQRNEISEIKNNLKKEQQKVNRLFNEQKNVIAKYQIVITDSKKVMTKVDSLKKNPNSPAYKKAVKKAESLSKERNELSVLIENSKYQIDSINQIIANYETTLQELMLLQAESKKDKKSEKVNLTRQKKEKKIEKPSNKNEKTIEQDSDVEVDKTLVRQDKEIFIDNERETIVEEPNEVGDTPLDLPEDYICERADNSNEIESSPIGFKALLLKIWKFIKILFWIIIGIIVLVLFLKIIGSTSTSSSSYSSNSQTDKDAKRRQIANLQRDIAYLQGDLQRARANYARDKSRTNKNYIASYKIQIAQKRAQIASIRASMH